MKKPLVILAGPTACGKTAMSIRLAKKIGGEIISADSMQIYKYMDIGTAKVSINEMDGIKHYLIDELNPKDDFNIVKFQKMAKSAIDTIYSNGHIPILVGGTGFYIQSILYDIDFDNTANDHLIRNQLEKLLSDNSPEYMHQLLKEVDPQSADNIHYNNTKRVIRALEFYRTTGKKISQHNELEHSKVSPYSFRYFVMNMDRKRLYGRIDRRVDKMVEDGLVEEVKHLKDMGLTSDMISMQGIGYKELMLYLEGNGTIEDAVSTIKRDTRRFAKRQITWFKREKDARWYTVEDYQDDRIAMCDDMIQEINKIITED